MSPPVLLADLSSRIRVGCKGPAAEGWLQHHGITVPSGANRYSVDGRGLLSARLATSEFLFECLHEDAVSALAQAKRALEYADVPSGVYPVLRQDFAIELRGPAIHDVFAQTCAIDLAPVERDSTASGGPVVLTSMIGVSVVITCRTQTDDEPHFTLWSDPSYSHYFWQQLLAIATELGGGAVPVSPTRPRGIHS